MAQSDAVNRGLRMETASQGAYGELQRRLVESPLRFAFCWHGTDFTGRFEARNGGVRLTIQTDLAALPYSAENARVRTDLLAIADAFRDEAVGNLKVVRGQKIMIEKTIDLSTTIGSAVSDIVASPTDLVLRTAPCLDLLAEYAAARRALVAGSGGRA